MENQFLVGIKLTSQKQYNIIKPLNRGGGAIMGKATFQPNNRKKSKKHGFFARTAKLLKARRKKGRKVLSK